MVIYGHQVFMSPRYYYFATCYHGDSHQYPSLLLLQLLNVQFSSQTRHRAHTNTTSWGAAWSRKSWSQSSERDYTQITTHEITCCYEQTHHLLLTWNVRRHNLFSIMKTKTNEKKGKRCVSCQSWRVELKFTISSACSANSNLPSHAPPHICMPNTTIRDSSWPLCKIRHWCICATAERTNDSCTCTWPAAA